MVTTGKKAFVVGWPIEHSRSPLLHGYWLKKHNIAGTYEKLKIHPDKIHQFLRGFRELGYVGGNVTMPHKESAFEAVDVASERAQSLGAVNTVWLQNDKLMGDNTDVYGFLSNLDALAPGWSEQPGTALIIGAGGAARAIVFSLVERGFHPIWVLNRTAQRAIDLANFFGDPVVGTGLDSLPDVLPEAQIVVNTTSAGMEGTDTLAIDWSYARSDAIATDIVYYPIETDFLKCAKRAGLTTVDGLGMLLHQAIPGFEQWFEHCPEVDRDLRALVLADIEG